MSPSAIETVVEQVQDIKEKVLPVNQTKPEVQPEADAPAPAVQPPNGDTKATSAEELPELYTGHKEPLKLSGALDSFNFLGGANELGWSWTAGEQEISV